MGFYDDVRAASEARDTKAAIIEYYQEEYGSKWKRQLVSDLAAQTGMKPKSLEKRFDPQRRENPEPRNASQYQDLGAILPPIPPEDGYHIHGTIYILFSGDQCKPCHVDEYISGEEAEELARGAGIQGVIDHYMDDEGYGPCNESGNNLTVEVA